MDRVLFEPFRIKVVEPLRRTTRAERERLLSRAHFNPFLLAARDVMVDLLTDSGTTAMSARQWGALMQGDESYAGSESYHHLKDVVDALTGLAHFIPTHQGRAAERILFSLLGDPGKVFISNTFFDTTRANVEFTGARALDLPAPEAADRGSDFPFKGNLDVAALDRTLGELGAGSVPLVLVTVTNNSGGGQPVSLDNLRRVRAVARAHCVPLFLDACRFAENAWFIQRHEPGQADRSLRDIARDLFALADGATFSGKKDALANMGGFLALREAELAERARGLLVLTEGFPTYGGMAGRDLEAMAVGLEEVLDQDYMDYRVATVRYLHRGLRELGVPVLNPPGGHAVYVDAGAFLDHLPRQALPGQALVNALYLEGGVRAVEIGTVMFGENAPLDQVRLALPRRVHTQSHIDYVIEVFGELVSRREALPGYRITWEPRLLRHFTARFEPLASPHTTPLSSEKS